MGREKRNKGKGAGHVKKSGKKAKGEHSKPSLCVFGGKNWLRREPPGRSAKEFLSPSPERRTGCTVWGD